MVSPHPDVLVACHGPRTLRRVEVSGGVLGRVKSTPGAVVLGPSARLFRRIASATRRIACMTLPRHMRCTLAMADLVPAARVLAREANGAARAAAASHAQLSAACLTLSARWVARRFTATRLLPARGAVPDGTSQRRSPRWAPAAGAQQAQRGQRCGSDTLRPV